MGVWPCQAIPQLHGVHVLHGSNCFLLQVTKQAFQYSQEPDFNLHPAAHQYLLIVTKALGQAAITADEHILPSMDSLSYDRNPDMVSLAQGISRWKSSSVVSQKKVSRVSG